MWLWSIKSSPTPTPTTRWLWYRVYSDAPPQGHPFKTIRDNWCILIQRCRDKWEDRRTGLHWKTERKSVQFVSRVWFFVTPWTAAHQASLSIANSRSRPKPTSIELVMPSNHLFLCCPLLILPSIFPSISVFTNESALRIRWPKYWSFNFNISLSNEHSRLISFRKDWLDLLAIQGTLKSLLQHHSSKASILRGSAFFVAQLSHPYTTTGKTIALTRHTYVAKLMSLLFIFIFNINLFILMGG